MNKIITIFQMFLGVLLIALILLQPQGTGLGSAWGGEGKSYHTKRGAEKIIFTLTVLTAVVFVFLSLFNFVSH